MSPAPITTGWSRPADAPIDHLFAGIRCSGWPVAVTEPGGRLLGVVRIDEVLDALRRQRR